MKIYAFHLLNDYSGSPKVLMQLTKGWIANGHEVCIATSSGKDGFLSGIEGAKYQFFWYKWASNPILRFINLLLSQIILCSKLIFKVKQEDIIYINTVLPFGAALLGWLTGSRIIYHIHETSMSPPILKKTLFGIAKKTADDVIYVSRYLSKKEHFKSSRTYILYNAIEQDYLDIAKINRKHRKHHNKVLMVCSLKSYKGVYEFIALARDNEQFKFRLVLNSSKLDIENYFNMSKLPRNIEIFDTQTNLHPFFQWADVILNLSRPDGWVETFGLTIIEGMAYGLPAIVPPVGGITEIVKEGKNGFLVDSRDHEQLNQKLNLLLKNYNLYSLMNIMAKNKIERFSESAFIQHSLAIINNDAVDLREMRNASNFNPRVYQKPLRHLSLNHYNSSERI